MPSSAERRTPTPADVLGGGKSTQSLTGRSPQSRIKRGRSNTEKHQGGRKSRIGKEPFDGDAPPDRQEKGGR